MKFLFNFLIETIIKRFGALSNFQKTKDLQVAGRIPKVCVCVCVWGRERGCVTSFIVKGVTIEFLGSLDQFIMNWRCRCQKIKNQRVSIIILQQHPSIDWTYTERKTLVELYLTKYRVCHRFRWTNRDDYFYGSILKRVSSFRGRWGSSGNWF